MAGREGTGGNGVRGRAPPSRTGFGYSLSSGIEAHSHREVRGGVWNAHMPHHPVAAAVAVDSIGLRTIGARRIALQAAAVVGFALLTAAAAQVAVPVPGTTVPMTLQTLAVMLCGLALGSRLGMVSMGVYLLAGLVGLPVLAQWGGGVQAFAGGTVGFLLGFVVAQPVIAAGRGGGLVRVVAAAAAGMAIVYACGLLGLTLVGGRGVREALVSDLAPFVLGDVIKIGIAAAVASTFQSMRKGARA